MSLPESLPEYVKIQVYCPKDAVDEVRLAVGQAGAGGIGNYAYCAFVSAGTGYFLPLEGANPTIGQSGKIEQVAEMRIDFLCHRDQVRSVVQVMIDAHPYEEVAYEIVPMLSLDLFD